MLLLLADCLENETFSVRRIAPLILAYLAVWTVFGSFSYWGDTVLHEFVEQVPVLAGAIAPGVVLLAGVYQLTPMKRVCLAKCRREGTAFATLTRPGDHNLWIVGLRHGVFCLGSCWALMLLMFAIGGVNLAWMLILGAIMTVERQNQWGEGVARPLGVVLIIVSVLLFVVG
jgi:predicted metal-binding membrane protein